MAEPVAARTAMKQNRGILNNDLWQPEPFQKLVISIHLSPFQTDKL